MLKNTPSYFAATVRRCLPLALLLSFAVTGLAQTSRAGHGAGLGSIQMIAAQETEVWDADGVPEPQAEQSTDASGRKQLPPWLQIVLTVGIALLIYYLIVAIIRTRQRRGEEIIIHKPDDGFAASTEDQPRGPVVLPEQKPSDYRLPRPDQTGGQNKPQTVTRKSSWGIIFVLIMVLNIIRHCVQNK